MMSSFESMKTKIESTGIYNVTEGTNISKELRAYAEGIDSLFDKLAEMERECFVETAESYGLSERERFVGVDRSGETVERRRELLETAEQLRGDCTVSGFEKIVRTYGLENFKFVEHPTGNYLLLYVYDKLTDEQKAMIKSRVNEDFPAHINVTIYFM
ncbi:MAG: hypothetical protein J1E85_06820 [Ruminococcus sp.]|nr:hypothetical protein [Ruminococcus sp.]